MMAGSILPTQRLVPGLIEPSSLGVRSPGSEGDVKGAKFSDMIADLVSSVNGAQKESAAIQQAFVSGEPVELHQVMIKAEEAGVSTELLLQIRNRLVDAYREIMRMPM
ncbi:MAG: flagellar hook-basal body complex protein FliE [bacterium]|nr:flagellar hook-basal body complex protein FliE [bacterium]